MEEIMKTAARIDAVLDSALANTKRLGALLQAKDERIAELELERATLLVVVQRLRDERGEGLKQ